MLLALLALFFGAVSMPGHALAGSPDAHGRAEALTTSLMGLNRAYQHASPAAKAAALESLVNAAAERQALLTELMEEDPGAVLRVAVPARVRAGMPEEVSAFIEQHVQLEGELEVLYEDHEDGSHRLRHFLTVYEGRISLHFKAEPRGLLSGTPVRAAGVLLGDAMALESGESILTLAADGGSTGGSSGGAPAPVPNTFGEQRTLILLVNFATLPEEPWSVTEARATVFGPVSDFFRENSYGQTWLAGDVVGWLTIDVDPSGCPTTDIRNQARIAAGAQGIDLSAYNRQVFAFPDIGCSWSGQATVGGSPSYAMLDGTLLHEGIVSHELGHTFGLYHSHALECGNDIVGDTCVTAEYGDALDRMGNHGGGHFNAFQKARLGWLDYGTSPAITTADASGLYQLEASAAQSQGAKALRVPRDVDPATGQTRWYYLEYRKALGFDSFLANSRYGASVTNGVVFHLGKDGDPNSSALLDMTPNSLQFDWDDMALSAGTSFTDAASGATIVLEQVDSGGATVSVDLGTGACIHRNPAVTLAPSEGPWVNAGTPVDYVVTVTNNDSDACGASTFDLATVAPAGWNTELDASILQIGAGANATVTMIVTSPQTATEGFHDITVTASSTNDPVYAGSATATYVITAPEPTPTPTCTVQTPSLGLSPSSQNGDPGATLVYTVSLVNTDSDGCTTSDFDLTITALPGGWNGSLSAASMSLSPGSSGTATLWVSSAGSATAGNYGIQVAVSDALETTHARTATATYVVNDPVTAEDTQSPTEPTGLGANEKGNQVDLTWNASTDNVGVAGYRVWRDGVVIAETAETGYSDRDLADSILYEYRVDAYDAADNVSGTSTPVMAGKAKAKAKGSGGGKGKGNNK
ncbi:MAG: NEW3 domain-containing protein [Gammaproteobacteria bacterium]